MELENVVHAEFLEDIFRYCACVFATNFLLFVGFLCPFFYFKSPVRTLHVSLFLLLMTIPYVFIELKVSPFFVLSNATRFRSNFPFELPFYCF